MGLFPAELTGLLPALGFALVLSLLPELSPGSRVRAQRLRPRRRSPGRLPPRIGRRGGGRSRRPFRAHPALLELAGRRRGRRGRGGRRSPRDEAGPPEARSSRAPSCWPQAWRSSIFRPQKAAWKPLRLVEAGDTPYGKLQVIRNEEQVTFFDNGLAVFSHPDEGAAEEAVHFALLQRDGPRRVLLVGGGASGGAAEALKYPDIHVDCVELDPAIIRLADKHLPGPVRTALVDPRVRIIFRDGRTFIGRTEDRYGAILLSLPEPATAQINRYYTREFFLQVRGRLLPGGVFSFVVPSAENYISQPLAQFLGSLAATLRGVFPHVLAVPGGNCVFLASDAPLSIDPGFLSAAVARLGLDLRYLGPGMLKARLDPARVDDLAGKLSAPDARINRDLVPVSYYFHAVLWAGQFRGAEARVLRAAGRIAPFWILDAAAGGLRPRPRRPGGLPTSLPGPFSRSRGGDGLHLDRR